MYLKQVPAPPGARPFPLGSMAACVAGVLLAHLLVLDNAARHLSDPTPVIGTQVFTTRTLRPPAPVPPAPPGAAPVPPAAAGPAPRSPTAKPRAAAALQRPATAAPEPATAPAPLPAPTQAAASEPEASANPIPNPVADATRAPFPEQAAAVPVAEAPLPGPAPSPGTGTTQAQAPAGPPAPSTAPPATTAVHDRALEPRTYAIPGSVMLKFNATGQRGTQPMQASGSLSWQHDGQRYAARMEMGAFGLGARIFSSTGAITADGLAPSRFADRRRTEVASHFDRAQARVVFSANTPTVTLQPGAQDQLSIFIQLASIVGGEPRRFAAGQQIAAQTVGPRAAEEWVFTVQDTETLQLPGGELVALKLVRLPNQDYDQKLELWLAPALSWLPARIRITFANGDVVDQQWRASSTP